MHQRRPFHQWRQRNICIAARGNALKKPVAKLRRRLHHWNVARQKQRTTHQSVVLRTMVAGQNMTLRGRHKLATQRVVEIGKVVFSKTSAVHRYWDKRLTRSNVRSLRQGTRGSQMRFRPDAGSSCSPLASHANWSTFNTPLVPQLYANCSNVTKKNAPRQTAGGEFPLLQGPPTPLPLTAPSAQ